MKREIKFRAWYGGKMIELGDLSLRHSSSHWNQFTDATDCIHIPNTSPIMQYTGLKDKKKVEIYEGDIILDPVTGEHVEIRFYDGSFVLFKGEEGERPLVYEDSLYNLDIEEYLVIGNIYQHPELMK